MPVLLYEITIAIVVFIVLLFTIFYIVVEGSSWQKHRILGIFARFIQASFRRSFFVIPARYNVIGLITGQVHS